MRRWRAASLGLAAAWSLAPVPHTTADTPPAVASPVEADAEPADAEDWLRRLEGLARGRGGIDARLRYLTVQSLLDDRQIRFGRLRQAIGRPAVDGAAAVPDRFRIDLDGEAIDGALRKLDRVLVWDGERLLDADAKEREAKIRVLDTPADLADAVPIPMRIDADELLQRYEVTLLGTPHDPSPAEADPEARPGAVHLRLRDLAEPRADPLEVWFDGETGLPLRGRSGHPGGDTQTVDLVNTREVDAFEPGLFDTSPPPGPGWRVEGPAPAG